MSRAEAERNLIGWARYTGRRDEFVRAAYRAGVEKMRIHSLTGLSRKTIDRILNQPQGDSTVDIKTYSAQDIVTAVAKRLAADIPGVTMDSLWLKAVAENGIELAENGTFTIELENGQRFHIIVTEQQ